MLDEVLAEAPARETMEGWMDEVAKGAALPDLYPMNAEIKGCWEALEKGV